MELEGKFYMVRTPSTFYSSTLPKLEFVKSALIIPENRRPIDID